MLTLYQRTDCPFCWKVRLALDEHEIEYQRVDTTLGEKHPDIQRLSPTGSVPVLVDGELAIWESAVILEYIDARYAVGKLINQEPVAGARDRLLHAYSDKIVGGCLREIVFEKRSRPEDEWDHDKLREGEARWRDCRTWLEQALSGRPYFGGTYSAPDCALAARFGVAEAYGVGVDEEFPGLFKWYRAVTGRPSWERAFPTGFIRTD
mgnify:FL=1